MNTELAKSISEVVDLTKEGVVQGLSIIQAQVPELCQQILAYAFWSNLIAVVGYIILLSTLVHFLNISKKEDFAENFNTVCMAILAIFTLVFSIIILKEVIPVLIQILVAPKLYLIEYLSRLI